MGHGSKYLALKAFFVERDIRLQEPAKLLGVTVPTLSRKINRAKGADFKGSEINQLCKAYHLDANKFFLL